MKKKYYLDKYLLQGWIIGSSASIILLIINLILKLLSSEENSYFQISLFILFFLIILIRRAFQWVEIDNKGIFAKSLFGTIKFCPWEDINKIEISTTLEGKFTPKYFIIFSDDNIEEKYRLTYNRFYLNIRVPYCEETKKIIEKYYSETVIDLPYETILKRRKNKNN